MDKYVVAPPLGSTDNSVGAEDGKWQKGYFENLPNWQEYLEESTGYGIVSGCEPSISGLTVTVAAGVVHLADGTRKEIAETNITLDAADSTNPRIDLVYIDSTGTVAKITGTATASPSAPGVPTGGISVAQIKIAAGATVGIVVNKPTVVLSLQNLPVVNLSDYGSLEPEYVDDTLKRAIDDLDNHTLLLPNKDIITSNNVTIDGHSNFRIVGSKGYKFSCARLKVLSCHYFIFDGVEFIANGNVFMRTDFWGDLSYFTIKNCVMDSPLLGADSIQYGFHIGQDMDVYGTDAQLATSPRHFTLENNVVKNTKYNGILVHATCSYFTVQNNHVISPECIGIEVEGRIDASWETPIVMRSYYGNILDNYIENAQDWGILIDWSEHINVKNNRCVNCKGAFLSIGCGYCNIVNNYFEGTAKGFEISTEFYPYGGNYNSANYYIIVEGNTIRGVPRNGNYGILDVRHSSNIKVINNNIIYIGSKDYDSCIQVASSEDVKIVGNYMTTGISGVRPQVGISFANYATIVASGTVINLLKNVEIRGNIIKSCVYGISSPLNVATDDSPLTGVDNLVIADNIVVGDGDTNGIFAHRAQGVIASILNNTLENCVSTQPSIYNFNGIVKREEGHYIYKGRSNGVNFVFDLDSPPPNDKYGILLFGNANGGPLINEIAMENSTMQQQKTVGNLNVTNVSISNKRVTITFDGAPESYITAIVGF